ncbi:MAG: sigma-54-dependent Fis family transcriptional regulator [Phycisphaeraceae bacterium]|nr:sigma-54-dependent Fis family transcriptional regulator [Phycisphaeraceae bacterium]
MSQKRNRILVVDDDPIAAESLAEFLDGEGFDPTIACNGAEGLARIEGTGRESSSGDERGFAVALCDVSMPVMGGVEFLRHAAKKHPAVAVVMLTGYGTIESAVEAVRLGAVDFLTKPVVDQELRIALQRAMRHHTLMAENRELKARIDERFGLDQVVGSDPRMSKTLDLVRAVAPSKTTVLMTGESGTGKSLIAQAIHQLSPRANKPFVQLSCGSIPETLLESELFGHVKGAFTGAHADKVGRFLAADGGTIFLDEINSASAAMQLKLLRVLQERKFEPVGSSQTTEVDVRVILATNRPLEDLVRSGEFRQDLYYRINVVQIALPSLRERLGDVPVLAAHFLTKHAAALGRQITGFSPEAMGLLQKYGYPGNVRELENIVERAAVLATRPTIGVEDLPEHVAREMASPRSDAPLPTTSPDQRAAELDSDVGAYIPMSLEQALLEPERRVILRALRANNWNRQKTADDLQINRTTLYKKMKLLGIELGGERMAG